MAIVIDQTHVGRRATGIERVTRALLSPAALAPLPVEVEVAHSGRLGILMKQAVTMPAKAAVRPGTVWVFPGFPPSPAFALIPDRVVLYVHDVFPLSRPQDLNFAARAWFAPNFARALRTFSTFLVNSETTGADLRAHARSDAQIVVYRPAAENVFGLHPRTRAAPVSGKLVLGAIGTLEPRKNFIAAARIAQALARQRGAPVELHVIGRDGWGQQHALLAREDGVVLHDFLPDAAAREVISGFDALICTSHAEGLCLPLLEVQFAGLPVIAPNQPVFREVLGASGLYVDPAYADAAAGSLRAFFADADRLAAAHLAALHNIVRWNAHAAADKANAMRMLARLVNIDVEAVA